MIARVEAREKQLQAWAHMLTPRALRTARVALAVTGALRIAAYVALVFVILRAADETGLNAYLALPLLAVSWLAVSAPHLWARDRILARAFATLTPAGTRAATAPSARGPRGERPPARPRQRAQRARQPERDRDALDFDDAA